MRISPATLNRIITSEIKSLMESKRRAAKGQRRPSLYSALFEDADPAKIDLERFPAELSKAAADPNMKKKVKAGLNDKNDKDDVVKTKAFDGAVSGLKPSQSTMKVSNAVGMAIGMLVSGKPGGDLGAFISSDNYIMDGHHRWIATFMVDPSASVQGTQISLPGEKLVPILNAITAGLLGNQGNPGKGSFADFKNKDMIVQEINTVMEKGVPKFNKEGKQEGYFTTPEDAKATVEKNGGADKLADRFIKNLGGATLAAPPFAVPRIEMPVINPGENTTTAKNALEKGEIDLNPPYATEEGESGGDKPQTPQNSGRLRNGGVMVERWQRLAGILR